MTNIDQESAKVEPAPAPVEEILAPVSPAVFNRSWGRVPRSDFTGVLQQLGRCILICLLCVVNYLIITHFLVQSMEVVGTSMVPTLRDNGYYLVNRWVLRSRDPRRNDVAVIRDPEDHGLSVKRVIAVAGDSILFKNGKVFVNGKELNEPYLLPNTPTFMYQRVNEEFITCGKGQYFVLGDNRPVSIDSRAYGPVPRENFLGLVMLR
jgi:signal peptidase I